MKIIANNIARKNASSVHLSVMKRPVFGRLVVPSKGKMMVVKFQHILFCKADGNYTHIQLCNGRSILVSKCLKHIVSRLSNTLFIRIHQSYLVNVGFIKAYSDGEIELDGFSESLPLSRRHKKEVGLRLGS